MSDAKNLHKWKHYATKLENAITALKEKHEAEIALLKQELALVEEKIEEANR